MTVFVGPNNSGKTLILREIHNYLQAHSNARHGLSNGPGSYRILAKLEQLILDVDRFMDMLYGYATSNTDGGIQIQVFNVNAGNQGYRFVPEEWKAAIAGNNQLYILEVLRLFSVLLDGSTRLNYTNPHPAGDLQVPPQNVLTALFRDNVARSELSNFTLEAFGYYFVIDPTGLPNFRIKLSKVAPDDLEQEQGLSARSIEFHKNAVPIESFSDGIKAALGTLIPLLCGDFKDILIDEPEAFLHPPLARRLGRKIAQISKQRDASLFVSTHSSEFLMGCVEAGVGINLVRMTYANDVGTVKLLPAEDLLPLMRNPLLRSTDTLSALFHRSAIVTESDTDRIFYQEINLRLIEAGTSAVEDCSFLNAQNWQTIHHIIRPLRRLGVRSAAIVDVDVLMTGGDGWKQLLEACELPDAMIQTLGMWKGTVDRALLNAVPSSVDSDKKRRHVKLNGGISLLNSGDLDTAQRLLDTLAEYGLFVVPGGEVESWLPYLGNRKHGPDWVVPMLESLGGDPRDANYVRPPIPLNDVWGFMGKIAKYLNN